MVTKMTYAIPSHCRRTGKLNSRNFLPYRNYSAVLGGMDNWGAYHLAQNFENSGRKVNGKVIFRKFQPKIEDYVLR